MDYPSGLPTNEVSYRRFDDDASPLTEADIPLRPENRKKTDRAFSFVLSGCVTLAIIFLAVIVILDSKHQPDRSESLIPEEDEVVGSFRQSHEEAISIIPDVKEITWKFTFITFVSLGLTVVVALMYRHATSFVVWTVLLMSWAYFFAATVALWLYVVDGLVTKLVFTFITIMLLCVLVFMKDKIRLVTMLFKEAAKATFDMQAIFSVPIATIFLLVIVVAIYMPATFCMGGNIWEKGHSNENEYISNDARIGLIIFNSIIAYWVCQFIIGIQYMIVSGAVTKWYFTRNKELLGDPIYTSFYVAFKHHLGTAALGSLIITIVAVIRAIIRYLSRNSRFRLCIMCCLGWLEDFVRFFTKSAYIVTAMHGTPFIKSGKQAAKLLTVNICNTITINSLGDFVLTMSTILIVGLSVAFTYLIVPDSQSGSGPICYIFAVGISLVCCCSILGTFEISFSTMFLCVCQDFLINNGNDKPYAMTRNLMEFLDESKKLFADKIEKKNLPKI